MFYMTKAFRVAVANDWKDKGLDVVLCPGFGCPAIEIGQAGYATGKLTHSSSYMVNSVFKGHLNIR